jgi:hypothetical protein
MKTQRDIAIFAGFALLMLLPLVGVWWNGGLDASYLEFPPLTHYVRHAEFSRTMFIGLAVIIILTLLPFVLRVFFANFAQKEVVINRQGGKSHDPKKGIYLLVSGVLISAVFWFLTWNRFAWFANFQIYTFTPLWVGYILAVNGITQIRSGECMFLNSTERLIKLFVLSALFWWFFEYLNRFVQNWYYVGIGELSPMEYFFYATLPFATVLPAVIGTCDMLKTFPRLYAGLDNFIKIKVPYPKFFAIFALAIFAAGLALIGVYPDYLFPLLWVSPLGILISLQVLQGQRTIFAKLADGDWREVAMFAFSALICGFFWELWNYHSVAKWIYEVPFVGGYKLFEMPILGFSGYLPFGLECAVIAAITKKNIFNSKTFSS